MKIKRRLRKPYRKSRAFDPSCRCHGSCEICKGNRLKKFKVREQAAIQQVKEYEGE